MTKTLDFENRYAMFSAAAECNAPILELGDGEKRINISVVGDGVLCSGMTLGSNPPDHVFQCHPRHLRRLAMDLLKMADAGDRLWERYGKETPT